ncbi:beta-lactamase-like protein [Roridomyces roridus]|uniref:Beta-lactamase-like protein n=1 Tax=Roridomyces roridus TaxID=1738132 RepID=A0AAD7CEL0_9AGAR|nr:beta-lactamase-like protein [Roridomyces roridus]
MFLSKFLSFLLLVGVTRASFQDHNIPQSNALVTVKAFDVGSMSLANSTHSFYLPVLPGRETITAPMYAFLVEHQATGKRVMFDLGIRKDPSNLAPSLGAAFVSGAYQLNQTRDILQQLQDGGITLASIDTVIWSHSHFDHIGDMSKFPNSTNLLIGPGTVVSTYPENPNATLLASDFAGHNVTELDFTHSKLVFSGLTAIDYFRDGSFYLLDTPGHMSGHISALARVTPTTFVSLSADTLHHAGQARPRPAFQNNFPCPAHLVHELKSSVSTDYFWSPKSQVGAFDIKSRAQQMLAISDLPDAFYEFPVPAQVSLEKMATFDADPDFLMVFSHDRSVRGTLPVFPKSLNNWKVSGLKERTVWNFADPSNPAWLFSAN